MSCSSDDVIDDAIRRAVESDVQVMSLDKAKRLARRLMISMWRGDLDPDDQTTAGAIIALLQALYRIEKLTEELADARARLEGAQ